MKNFGRLLFWALVPFMAGIALADPAQKTPASGGHPILAIAAGDVDGVYFPMAGAICRALQNSYAEQGIRHLHCHVATTSGSIPSLMELADQEQDLAIVQSDAVRKAWEGEAPFQTPMKQLRSVLTLYTETLTLVVPARPEIRNLDALKGKPLTLGTPGGGTGRIAMELLTACGFKAEGITFKTLNADDAAQALDKREVDAYLLMVGHPNETVWNLTSTQKIALIPLTGECAESLTANNRFYVKTTIPGGMYPGLENDTRSLGIRASLVTTADASEETIHALTKTVVEKLYRFKAQHPDAALPNPRSLFEGLIAPLHLGAFRYFQELRVLEYKQSGTDIQSDASPLLIDPRGGRIPLQLTADAPEALAAVKPLIAAPGEGEAGLPTTPAPAIAQDIAISWLLRDAP